MVLSLLDGITNFFNNTVVTWILNFLSFIPKLVYFIATCLLSVVDFFQVTFRKLAGMDPVMIGQEVTKGDSVYKIISDALLTGKYPAINTMFWSLIILGILMLIVTSIMAVIRIEYRPDKEKGNSKAGIVKNFLTALFTFAIVPIASLFGMFLANELVQAVVEITASATPVDETYNYFDTWDGVQPGEEIDPNLYDITNSYMAFDIFGETIPTNTQPFSGVVFKACAHGCNRFRMYGDAYLAEINNSSTDLGIFGTGQITEASVAADIIDTAFSINARMKNTSSGGYSLDKNISGEYYSDWLSFFGSTKDLTHFSKYNVELVWYFYYLWIFNYIIAFAALVLMSKMYMQYCLSLMARLFEIAGLFIFAPVPVSMMPLDNGAALDRWRGDYIKRFSLLLFMVFGMNLVYPFMTIFGSIKFFGSPILDYIISTFVIVAGLNAVQSISKMLTGILLEKGGETFESSMKSAGDTLTATSQGFQATKRAAGIAATPVKLAGRGIATSAGGAIMDGIQHRREAREQRYNNNIDRTNREERQEINNSLNYDSAQQTAWRNTYDTDAAARNEMAGDFMATEQGRQFANRYYRGNMTAAENAIRSGRTTRGTAISAAQRNELAEFMFNRDRYSHSVEGQAAIDSGNQDQFRGGLNNYIQSDRNQRIETMVGGNLSARQTAIQAERQGYEHQHERRTRRNDRFTRIVGRSRERVFNPVFSRGASNMQDLLDLIHGRDLFFRRRDGGGNGGGR